VRSVVSVFLLSTAIASIGCGGASDSKAGKNARPRLGGAVLNGSKERIAALLEAGALPVDINASALTKHTLSVPGVVSSFDSTEVQHLVLMPGVAYSLESSEGTFGAFTVTADGNINYDDAALSYIFSGKGTTTLSVKAVFIQLATGQLTKQSISVRGVGDPFTSGGGFHNVKLAPGLTYHLTSPIRGEEFGAFTVTRFGSIELDPASSGSLTVNGDDILSLTAVTITVDATMLTKLQLEVRAVGDAFDSKEQRQFKLAPGQAYAIYSGVIGYLGIFNVTSVGKIQFEPSLNATFGLRDNDTTLVVKGVEIFIDAHLLTKQRLTVYGFGDGFDSKGPPYSVTLPPGGALYSFGVWSPVQGVLGSFHVSADGTVNYDPPFDAVFSGRGTNTLVLNAFPVMIDARQLPQQTLSFLNIGDAFDSKLVTRFMLSPSTPYTLYSPVHGFLGVFILRPNGAVDFDHLLD